MLDPKKPTLNFVNMLDGVTVQMAFVYSQNMPVVAMFHEESLIIIPKEILQIALEQGWTKGVE